MRTINEHTFNELIRVMRKFHKTGDTDILAKRNNLCDELEEQSKVYWIVFADLSNCFAKLKTSDQDIHVVMKDLGFTISDKEGEE